MSSQTDHEQGQGTRCPSCEARNPVGAEWCSLCYASMTPTEVAPDAATPDAGDAAPSDVDGSTSPAAPATTAPPAAAPAPTPPPVPALAADPPEVVPHPAETMFDEHDVGAPLPIDALEAALADQGTDDGDVATLVPGRVLDTAGGTFRDTNLGPQWRCGLCETWNGIEAPRCVQCGAEFGALLAEPVPPAPEVDEFRLLISSIVLPGSGHRMLGRGAMGGGIAAIYVTFVLGAFLLLSSADGNSRGLVAVLPLLLGAVALLAGSVIDALNLRRGAQVQLLTSRVLLWLVVGVLGLVTMILMFTAISVNR